jgi:transposase
MNLYNRPGPTHLTSDGLIRYLKAYADKLPHRHILQLWSAVDQLTLLERQIQEAERIIASLIQQHEHFRRKAELLNTIPGAGLVVSSTVIAEIGDFTRFPTPETIARYAGLDPRLFQSANTRRTGHISKCGSPELRRVLVQPAWLAIRCDEHIRKIWLNISKHAGRKKAIVALARRMLIWMWSIIRTGQPYRTISEEDDATASKERCRGGSLKAVLRQAKKPENA